MIRPTKTKYMCQKLSQKKLSNKNSLIYFFLSKKGFFGLCCSWQKVKNQTLNYMTILAKNACQKFWRRGMVCIDWESLYKKSTFWSDDIRSLLVFFRRTFLSHFTEEIPNQAVKHRKSQILLSNNISLHRRKNL